ncbi:unnamed protein product [Dicrocoelium dendriticum]|nr:unnamed protein product [Dicrocoelium dendriticum]
MFILVRRIRNSFKLFQRGFHNAKIASRTLCYPLFGSSALIGTYLCFLLLTDDEETPTFYPKNTSATLIRRLPFNATSRLICWLAECPVPVLARPVIYSLYAALFGCDLSELKYTDLKRYASVSDFFSRELAAHCRPIDEAAALVSPADGKILHIGSVDRVHPVLEQVKGINYSLREFLGPVSFDMDHARSDSRQKNSLRLYQCVIYLGPGDCHRFFNPTDWTVLVRRHFPG